MKNKTTLFIVGGLTLGVGFLIYYNWDWIQLNILGNTTKYSDSYGTEEDVVVFDNIQEAIVETDKPVTFASDYADEIEIHASATQDIPIQYAISNILAPSPQYDSATGDPLDDIAAVQVRWIDPGTYQFFFLQGDLSKINSPNAIVTTLGVQYDFGNGYVGPYLPIESPIISFPSSGLYPIRVSADVGSLQDGPGANVLIEFDLQVVI